MRRLLSPVSAAIVICGLSAPAAWGAGATAFSFKTYEAEAGTRSGGATLHQLTGVPTSSTASPEFEASGRAYVRLDATGESIRWTNGVANAKYITVRICVPDTSGGGGTDYSLALHVNGVFRQNLSVNSRYNWLYGAAGTNGQSNSPSSGPAHVFWDDQRFTISGSAVPSGQSVKLQKDSGNNASYYLIDLVDLDPAASASQPSNSINVTASPYNVVPNDTGDDRSGIQAAIDAAASQGKSVWIPTGLYRISDVVVIKGVLVQGAGHWNTRFLVGSNKRAFQLTNTGAKLRHVGIFDQNSSLSRSNTAEAINGVPNVTEQWNVEDVWVQHTGAAMWMSDSDNGSARRNRVYNVYADGINLNRGSHSNIVEQNYVRGVGDDCIAIISSVETHGVPDPVGTNNTVKFNTCVAPWWGVNMSFRGGSGHVFEDNKLIDSTYGAAMAVNLESEYNMHPITGGTFRRLHIVRGGGPKGSQDRAALWVNTGNKSITGLSFNTTTIANPIFTGIIHNGNSGHTQTVTASNTYITMSNPNKPGVAATHNVVGSATYTNGSITGTATQFLDDAPSLTLTYSGF